MDFNMIKYYRVLLLLTFFVSLHHLTASADNNIHPPTPYGKSRIIGLRQSAIYGPGLEPHKVVLPARYFYVELKDRTGENWNNSFTEEGSFKVKITCNGDTPIWTQVLDRHDGTYIIRYKVFDSCMKGFRISVMFGTRHIADSPFVINEPVHSDSCDCPQLKSIDWMKQVGCRTGNKQIEKDLSQFEAVDFQVVLDIAIERFHQPGAHSFCHYVIKDNKIYRKCYGQHVGFHIFPDAILTSLARKAFIPDLEFIINLGDWPLVDKRKGPAVPIFSWCKTDNHADILLPTYELTEASLEGMGRVSLDMMTVQSNTEVPWEDKIPQLFWRGRDSRQERLDLIMIARKHPDLFNASLTNFFFFRDKIESHGPKEPHVSFFKFFNYKYQLNIDGTVAAYRFPFLLGGDAVVLKTDSGYYEHFYSQLHPSKNYVPVNADLSNLVDTIKWLQDNDEEAKRIGAEGTKFARSNLMPLDVICYHMEAFTEWSMRLRNPVVVREDMEEVSQPSETKPRPVVCNCSPAFTVNSKKTEL